MEKKIYYTLYDAECAAQNFVKDHPDCEIAMKPSGGYLYGEIDDRGHPEEDDRFAENVGSWSGSCAAIEVRRKVSPYDTVALFGYWDDEID